MPTPVQLIASSEVAMLSGVVAHSPTALLLPRESLPEAHAPRERQAASGAKRPMRRMVADGSGSVLPDPRHAGPCCVLILQVEGTKTIACGDSEIACRPGDLLLVDSSAAITQSPAGRSRQMGVLMPRLALRSYVTADLVTDGRPAARLIDGRSAMGRILRGLFVAVADAADALPGCQVEIVRETLAGLAVAALDAEQRRRSRRPRRTQSAQRRWHGVQQQIAYRLSDPALSPAQVAGALGISTRHLHRVFRGAGTAFGPYVRAQRLERCRAELADPGCDSEPVTEIAFRWGFCDSSHFSRCFKASFGLTARDFRALARVRRREGELT
ncbi:MAG: helix-turn-helix domain-containing protein [Rhodospirillales bacterium]|nr:helix-turn-helix domain-containing protein [Rhodospirillales bacterium]